MKLSKILVRSEVASEGFTSVNLTVLKYCNATIQKKKTLIYYIELQLGAFYSFCWRKSCYNPLRLGTVIVLVSSGIDTATQTVMPEMRLKPLNVCLKSA